MALWRKLPIVNGSSPCGEIASLTSRGFGVVATIDTVVRSIVGFRSFIKVKSKPLVTSDGSSSPLGNHLLFALIVSVPDLNLARRRVDEGVHRLLKRRTFLNEVVTQEAECAALR